VSGCTVADGDHVLVPEFDLETKNISLREESKVSFIRTLVRRIFEAHEIEVVMGRDPQVVWTFRQPRHLSRPLELFSAERALIGRPWAHLFCITEWSGWLRRYLDESETRHGEAEIYVIEPSQERIGGDWPLRQQAAGHVENVSRRIHVGHIPWWLHNRHILLAVGHHGEFMGGTYTRRYLRASQVAPVALSEPDDCAELLRVFLAYQRHLEDAPRTTSGPLSQQPRRSGDLSKVNAQMRAQAAVVARKCLGHTPNWSTSEKRERFAAILESVGVLGA
jgi:hypothetical protein